MPARHICNFPAVLLWDWACCWMLPVLLVLRVCLPYGLSAVHYPTALPPALSAPVPSPHLPLPLQDLDEDTAAIANTFRLPWNAAANWMSQRGGRPPVKLPGYPGRWWGDSSMRFIRAGRSFPACVTFFAADTSALCMPANMLCSKSPAVHPCCLPPDPACPNCLQAALPLVQRQRAAMPLGTTCPAPC